MKSIDITIQDKEGLHARPAGILSKAAKGFESKVTMTKNGKVADMKKIFAVMGPGREVRRDRDHRRRWPGRGCRHRRIDQAVQGRMTSPSVYDRSA